MGEVGYKTLAIDIETFSDVDLIKCGVYAYADSPAFEILLFAYSFDDEETKIIDIRLIRMHYSTNLDLWRLRNN